jgi:putative transposase
MAHPQVDPYGYLKAHHVAGRSRLKGISRRRQTVCCTRRRPSDPVADDRVHRQYRADRPDRLWVQDVTQHPTVMAGSNVAVVIDAWSRWVVC